jgi:uncharacterized Zn-binding protein involved in type VI secretion
MPGIVRQDDKDSSLDVPTQYSSKTKIDGKFVHRHGDRDSDSDTVSSGLGLDKKVYIEGKPVVVVGDIDSAGDTKNNGSTTTFVG